MSLCLPVLLVATLRWLTTKGIKGNSFTQPLARSSQTDLSTKSLFSIADLLFFQKQPTWTFNKRNDITFFDCTQYKVTSTYFLPILGMFSESTFNPMEIFSATFFKIMNLFYKDIEICITITSPPRKSQIKRLLIFRICWGVGILIQSTFSPIRNWRCLCWGSWPSSARNPCMRNRCPTRTVHTVHCSHERATAAQNGDCKILQTQDLVRFLAFVVPDTV